MSKYNGYDPPFDISTVIHINTMNILGFIQYILIITYFISLYLKNEYKNMTKGNVYI